MQVAVSGEVCTTRDYGLFCLNVKNDVISRQLKTLFFCLYFIKMKCSVLEKMSCLIQRENHFIGGT